MAVAHDAVTEFAATFTTTSPATQSHTPAGTPRGVVVAIAHGEVSDDLITGVTYGGVAMERLGFEVDTTDEPGAVYVYFLGESIPTGAQTVSIAHTATATVKWANVATVTAAADTEIGGAGSISVGTTATNPNALIGRGPLTGITYGVLYSGHAAVASAAPFTGMTALTDNDFGNFVARFDRETTPASGIFDFGYTATGEDTALIAVSVQEQQSGAYVKGAQVSRLTTQTTSFTWRMVGQLADIDLYMVGISRDHTSGTAVATCTDSSGANTWTLVSDDPDRQLNVWWKRGAAADKGASVTVAGCVGSCHGGMLYVKGAAGASGDPTTNLTVETNAAADETHASITPTNPGSVVVFAVGDYGDDINAVTALAGATIGTLEPKYVEQFSTGGNDCRITVTGRTLASGATGNITWTQTDSTTKSVLFAVASTSVTVAAVPTDTIADTPTSLVEAAQAFTVLPPVAGIDVDVVIPEVTTHQFFGVDAAIASTLPAAAQTSETGLTVQVWMG